MEGMTESPHDLFRVRKLSNARKIITVVLLAFGVRIAVAPFTGHPFDLAVWINTGVYIVQGKSPYELYNHLGYPPLWGLWTALAYLASSFISTGNKFLYIFFIKLPIIVADLGAAYLLWNISQRNSESKASQELASNRASKNGSSNLLANKLVIAYLMSPFIITVGSVWGMMDSIAALLIVLAALTLFSKRDWLSGLLLGLAISLKLYPLILVPVFGIYLLKDKEKRLTRLTSFSCSAAITLGTTALLPFPLFHWSLTGLEGTMSAQVGRIPGGISPIGWLASLYDLRVYHIGGLSLMDLMKSTPVREAWIGILAILFLWLLTRPQCNNPESFLTQLALVMVVWYLCAPWASEPNVLVFLYLLLVMIAINPKLADRYFGVYWAVSEITLAFVLFNVPVTSFIWPVYNITFSGPLYKEVRAIFLLSIAIVFCLYLGRVCIRLVRSANSQRERESPHDERDFQKVPDNKEEVADC